MHLQKYLWKSRCPASMVTTDDTDKKLSLLLGFFEPLTRDFVDAYTLLTPFREYIHKWNLVSSFPNIFAFIS